MMTHNGITSNEAHAEEIGRIIALMKFLEEARRAKWRAGLRKVGSEKFLLDTVALQFHGYRNAVRRPAQANIFSREKLLAICDYLEMSRAAQTEALRLAGYVPQHIYPEGHDLEMAIKSCTEIMHDLPMPAYVLRPDWCIEAWNPYILNLLGWSDGQVGMMKANGLLNILYLIFNHDGGLRSIFVNWREVAYRNIYGFKLTNVLAQHEPWYKMVEEFVKADPIGKVLWDEIKVAHEPMPMTLEYETIFAVGDRRVTVLSLFICPGDYHCPHIVALSPKTEETWRIFGELGFPVSLQHGIMPSNVPMQGPDKPEEQRV